MFSTRRLVQSALRLVSNKELSQSPRVSSFSIRKRTEIEPLRGLCTARKLNEPLCEKTEKESDEPPKKPLTQIVAKFKLMFTCKKCTTRNSKIISKLAYEKGVVIVRCDGCKNNHLIADNLGWFSEYKGNVNIEKIMAMQGETVRKVLNDQEGYMEAVALTELQYLKENSQADTVQSNEGNALNSEEEDTKLEDHHKDAASNKT